MPIIKSAKKRVRLARRATVRNVKVKRTMREALKAFTKAVASGKSTDIIKAQSMAMSVVDQAGKKNIIHKNKVARIKARLAVQAKLAGAKPSSELSRLSTKTDTGRAARKSTTGKPAKTTAKKAASKPAAKKPATKKTSTKSKA